ncbi:hypothetical protein Bbelb_380720 [Branchiostoma belcheri]|nr:hypothetical protein Bbelb_380720 [Branchiostoma belcheri]
MADRDDWKERVDSCRFVATISGVSRWEMTENCPEVCAATREHRHTETARETANMDGGKRPAVVFRIRIGDSVFTESKLTTPHEEETQKRVRRAWAYSDHHVTTWPQVGARTQNGSGPPLRSRISDCVAGSSLYYMGSGRECRLIAVCLALKWRIPTNRPNICSKPPHRSPRAVKTINIELMATQYSACYFGSPEGPGLVVTRVTLRCLSTCLGALSRLEKV